MTHKRRLQGAVAAASVILAALCLQWLTQSAWLAGQLRMRVISAIERATGGRAEIGSIRFSVTPIRVDFNGVVLHGRESASEPSLFRAQSVHIALSLASFRWRDVNVESATVLRPETYLSVAPDGSTNLPTPNAHDPATLLRSLHVRHLRLIDGLTRVNEQKARYAATGTAVGILLNFDHAKSGYVINASAENLDVHSSGTDQALQALSMQALLQRDRLRVGYLRVKSRAGLLQASGAITQFASPRIDAHLWGAVRTEYLLPAASPLTEAQGAIEFASLFSYAPAESWRVRGTMSGQDLRLRAKGYRLRGIAVRSQFDASRAGIVLPEFHLDAIGASLKGRATFTRQEHIDVSAELGDLTIKRMSELGGPAWLRGDGIVRGPVHFSGLMNEKLDRVVTEAELTIAPLPGPLPISGSVNATFSLGQAEFLLKASHVSLAGTQLSAQGKFPSSLAVKVDSSDLAAIQPFISHIAEIAQNSRYLPRKGSLTFHGNVSDLRRNPRVAGVLDLQNFEIDHVPYDTFHTQFTLDSTSVVLQGGALSSPAFQISATGSVPLRGFLLDRTAALQLRLNIVRLDVARVSEQYAGLKLPIIEGIASASLSISGSVDAPQGGGSVTVNSLNAYGELLNRIQFNTDLNGRTVKLEAGRLQAGPAIIAFGASYTRSRKTWTEGKLTAQLTSTGFPLGSLSPIRRFVPDLDARLQIHAHLESVLSARGIAPSELDGSIVARHISFRHIDYGNLTFSSNTQSGTLRTDVSGDIQGKGVGGKLTTALTGDYRTTGDIRWSEINIAAIQTLIGFEQIGTQVQGSTRGALHLEGPLADLRHVTETLQVDELNLHLTSPSLAAGTGVTPVLDLGFANKGPLIVSVIDSVANLRSFHLVGRSTDFSATGTVALAKSGTVALRVDGLVNLAILQAFRAGLQTSGEINISARIDGALGNPQITGRTTISGGSILASNLTNGLTDLNGTIAFTGSRASIEHLEANSGGGRLSLMGFVTYAAGSPMVYNLQAEARNIRFRYANAISITGNSSLRLTGTKENGLLSGGITVSRVVLNTEADLGNVLASTTAPIPVARNQQDLLSGMQMDIHIESSDDLQLSTSLSQNVQTDVDLHLRGAPDRPVLLGTISANQGDIKLFGAKYTINRGVVSFVNPVKMEPVLDLDLQTETRGIAVNITVSGTPNKLNLNYRSDPPLQPKDIIALLTVGQAPSFTTANVGNAQVTNDTNALQAGANTVLGQAISPVSNRLSKLFGITNIKIDPLVQGITNTPQARLTLEQQVSRDITVTYITNLAQTSEQIFRFEWAFTPQYSVIAIRDDNGEFGIDIQYRKRFGGR